VEPDLFDVVRRDDGYAACRGQCDGAVGLGAHVDLTDIYDGSFGSAGYLGAQSYTARTRACNACCLRMLPSFLQAEGETQNLSGMRKKAYSRRSSTHEIFFREMQSPGRGAPWGCYPDSRINLSRSTPSHRPLRAANGPRYPPSLAKIAHVGLIPGHSGGPLRILTAFMVPWLVKAYYSA